MMQSEIRTVSYPNGEIQRFQILRWDHWNQLDFLTPCYSADSLDRFAGIYRNYLIPAAPWIFGQMVMFRLPETFPLKLPFHTKRYGTTASALTAAAAVLQEGVSIRGGEPHFRNDTAKQLWNVLEEQDAIRIVGGKLPVTKIIPVTNLCGYLTQTEPEAALKVNANFFIMDSFDCATVYDHVGTPFGLCVKDGNVLHPPMYNRESLLIGKNREITIRNLDVRDLELEINGQRFRHGQNAVIFTRPQRICPPVGRKQYLVITGYQITAISQKPLAIPASGFILCPQEDVEIQAGAAVVYHGLEDITFGIQVGNSILKDGIKTTGFHSKFYNIRHLEPIPFPPSLYPMNFDKSRAARIALGSDSEGKPILLWAEGAAKSGYIPGQGSCGASLKELAELCDLAGMKHAVNLDGGGSAQILLQNKKALQISDRDPQSFAERERPVPLGLIIK